MSYQHLEDKTVTEITLWKCRVYIFGNNSSEPPPALFIYLFLLLECMLMYGVLSIEASFKFDATLLFRYFKYTELSGWHILACSYQFMLWCSSQESGKERHYCTHVMYRRLRLLFNLRLVTHTNTWRSASIF